MHIEKYSIGVGDRFGHEGAAQLRALQKAEALGVEVVPVWNKSNREHTIIGTKPMDVRVEADDAVNTCGWQHSYYVDADHIGLNTVGKFIAASDFYTIDVADYIGKRASAESLSSFMRAMERFRGLLQIPGLATPLNITNDLLTEIACKYIRAVEEAGNVYRHIALKKGGENFVPEVSFDEAERSQSPAELFFILAAIAREGVPVQTIAPKFTGSFLKGIDYVGDIEKFAREFEDDLSVIDFAIKTFNLPNNLKLSVHSGSDKFSLYPIIHGAIIKHNTGLHLKTAGTTWLEEVIGLAASGGDGLQLAKDIYVQALSRFDELCSLYLSVTAIAEANLPSPQTVRAWSSAEYVAALQHDQSHPNYNVHFRQFVHVSFRIAAEMGDRYTALLRECRSVIEDNVTKNIFERHIQPLFLGMR